jgi:hypothetical protein
LRLDLDAFGILGFPAREKEGGANEKEGEERERLTVGYGTAGLLLLPNYLIRIREGKLWLSRGHVAP